MADWDVVSAPASPPDDPWAVKQQQPTTVLSTLGRAAGLTARDAVQGVLSIPATLADAPAAAYNAGASLLQGKNNGFRFPEQNQGLSDFLTKAGLPQPQNIGEKVSGAVSEMLTSAIPGANIANDILKGAKPVARAVTQSVPSVSDLKSQANAAYTAADNSGIILSKNSFGNMVGGLQEKLANAGIDASLHPKAMAAFNRLDQVDNNLTFKGADILRTIASNASEGATKSDKRLSRMMVDHIDDYINNLSPADVVGGADPTQASAVINTARNLWARASKGETIENIIKNARTNSSMFSQSGYENALRTGFRKLATNQAGMSRFNPAEQTAIRNVAIGAPVDNVMRQIGKLAPVGFLPLATSMGAAYIEPKALALPIIGTLGRAAATAMTANRASIASELVRKGAPLGIPQGGPIWTKQLISSILDH